MQISNNQSAKRNHAYVLLLTLAFLVVILIALASTMTWIVSNSKQTARNNQFVSSEYAAEAATERALGQMESDWLAGTMGSASSYAGLIPTNTSDWPVQYQFSDGNGNTNALAVSIGVQSTNWTPLPSPYSGLKAYITPITVTATATPTGQPVNVPATVSQTFDITDIPIFQYLIFYNMNLEIAAAATLNINGPVFSNAGIWTGSTTLTFSSTVWAVQQVVNGSSDPFVSYSGSGAATYSMRGEPVSGVNHVTMPIAGTNNDPTIVESILQWPPSSYSLGSTAAYSDAGEVYLANFADLIISNSANGMSSANPAGTNFFVYYQDPTYQSAAYNSNGNNWASSIIWVTNDYYIVSNVTKHVLVAGITNHVPGASWTTSGTNYQIWYAGYSFLTNVLFYDWREGWNGGSGYSGKGKTVYAVQFNVTNFNIWLANPNVNGGSNYNLICNANKNHSIGGVYIYNSVPLSTTVLPAVRVVNGAQLYDSYGLSIATPMPLYVLGNFNTQDGAGSDAGAENTLHSRPASFLADAITVLSSSWNDGTYSQAPGSASSDTVDAACLEGIVPSNSAITSGNSANYSGGVENFLRLLENWGNLYYNGSIVVMFPSQYATNRWQQTGNFYDAPNRYWSFDTNFTVRAKLPPFTPEMKTTIRNTWAGT
jgi:hypothetical protein